MTSNPGHREIGIGRMVYVAESDQQAKEESAEAVVRHIETFTGASSSGYLGTISAEDKKTYASNSYEDFCEDTILHGSPQTVIEKIHYMKETTQATSMILHFPPYYSRERTRRTIDLFAAAGDTGIPVAQIKATDNARCNGVSSTKIRLPQARALIGVPLRRDRMQWVESRNPRRHSAVLSWRR